MFTYEVHLCDDCMAEFQTRNPYPVPRHCINAISVSVAACDNTAFEVMELTSFIERIKRRNGIFLKKNYVDCRDAEEYVDVAKDFIIRGRQYLAPADFSQWINEIYGVDTNVDTFIACNDNDALSRIQAAVNAKHYKDLWKRRGANISVTPVII